MLNLSFAGNVGRDAAHKTTQSGQELCSFPVAITIGYGENKSTVWVDVTKWGKGSEGLARILRKGSKVAVSGELSTREYDGKTYLQCRANDVTIMSSGNGGNMQTADKSSNTQDEDLNDEIPF